MNCKKNCEAWRPLLPIDWQIAEDTVVQPDNLVVCGPVGGQKKLTKTPALVFEVLSPSTSQKDRGTKYRLYEAAGLSWYAIVSPLTKTVEIYRRINGKYSLVFEADESDTFTFELEEDCRFEFDFSGRFD